MHRQARPRVDKPTLLVVHIYWRWYLCHQNIEGIYQKLVNSDANWISYYMPPLTNFHGYSITSPFRYHSFLRLFVPTFSTKTSTHFCFLNRLMNLGSHNSDAIPKSLQQRMSALLLQPSVAVGMPEGSKKSCSPRATETSRPWQTRAYSRVTYFSVTMVSLRGAKPQAPGPKALLRIRRYLISGRYKMPSTIYQCGFSPAMNRIYTDLA